MLVTFIIYELFALLFSHYLMKVSKGEYRLHAYIIAGHLWPYVFISSLFVGKGGEK
jgi:hypothetical protein